MVGIFLLAVGLWLLGHVFGVPKAVRWAAIGLIYLGVLGGLLLSPGMENAVGGTWVEWALIGVAGAVVWLYSRGLKALKKRATKSGKSEKAALFSEAELERSARHIVLREIGGPGQKKLKQARVLVIGAGGLGAPLLQYLAAAGVGTIGVVDADTVENSNLQRQVIHKDASIGMPKVFSAEAEMRAQNPNVTVEPFNRRLDAENATELIASFDVILDGTDNFETRYLVNRTCVELGKPLIAAALSQWEGQISTYHPKSGGPCYQCIFPKAPAEGLAPSCAEAGVLGPLPGVLGSMMAVEAVKLITGAGEGLVGRMAIYDALYGENRTMKLKRDPACSVCG